MGAGIYLKLYSYNTWFNNIDYRIIIELSKRFSDKRIAIIKNKNEITKIYFTNHFIAFIN
jgi:hypothetical protein